MILRQYRCYKIKNGNLKIQVDKIKFRKEEYTKAKITIFNSNGIYLETINNAKLYHDKIKHWELA